MVVVLLLSASNEGSLEDGSSVLSMLMWCLSTPFEGAVSSVSSVCVPCSVGAVLGVFPVHWVEITAGCAFGRSCFLWRGVGVMPAGPFLRTHLTAKGAHGSDLPQE